MTLHVFPTLRDSQIFIIYYSYLKHTIKYKLGALFHQLKKSSTNFKPNKTKG